VGGVDLELRLSLFFSFLSSSSLSLRSVPIEEMWRLGRGQGQKMVFQYSLSFPSSPFSPSFFPKGGLDGKEGRTEEMYFPFFSQEEVTYRSSLFPSGPAPEGGTRQSHGGSSFSLFSPSSPTKRARSVDRGPDFSSFFLPSPCSSRMKNVR